MVTADMTVLFANWEINNMEKYKDFAYLYDKLTNDVNYKSRVDYIEKLFDLHLKNKPELIADVGCGTGTVCNILCDRGYDMIGIDASGDMLNVASEKSGDKNILYLNQDMTNFELYGTVDVILCLLDSVNYLTDDGELDKFFALCNNYLNDGGIVIFDVNTMYKFENILADNIYNFEDECLFYSWENNFDGKICEFYLNFFVKKDDGEYQRITEQHFERAYTTEEIENSILKSGLKLVAMYGDMSVDKPNFDEERVYFVAKKY